MTRRPVTAVLVAGVLAGCAAVGGPNRQAVLRLDPVLPPGAPASAGPRLSLAPVTAFGVAEGRRYAYVDATAPREVRQAATLFWEEPPARMVEQALLRGLGARLGTPVLPVAAAAGEARVLKVTLAEFEEVDAGGASRASVALDAVVVDAHTREPLLARRYCSVAPVGGGAPSARSAAFEAALNEVMDAMAADLRTPGATSQASAC